MYKNGECSNVNQRCVSERTSRYLFHRLSKESIDTDRKRHDAAIEKLQAAQIEWAHKQQQ